MVSFKRGSNVGGATPLMRKLAMSPASRYGMGALRFAGLTNPVGAAATAAYFTPKLIDKLTAREDDATQSSLFGIDLTQNANEQAALPESNLADWGFDSGVVPGDDIQEQVTETETETLDPNWQHQLRLQEMNREGIQAPGMWDKFKGMFQRPEPKQKEFEAYEASMDPQGWGDFGDYKGNIWEGSGGNKINVVDPVTGATVLQNKNFDSMFGSKSVQEMIDKKDAWIADRLLSGKKISKALTSYAMNKGLGTFGGDKPGIGPRKPRGDPTYGGPQTFDFNPSITGTKSFHPSQGNVTTSGYQGKQGSHHLNTGGYLRSRYNRGGRVGILAAF